MHHRGGELSTSRTYLDASCLPKASHDPYVSTELESHPLLLCRYVVTKLQVAILKKPELRYSGPVDLTQPAHPWDSRLGRERIEFSQSLRGIVEPDPKDEADRLAIGGLRNASEPIARLP